MQHYCYVGNFDILKRLWYDVRIQKRKESTMEFRRLATARDALFAEAFAVYEISFPKSEQRPLDRQAALMSNPLYHFNAIVEDAVFAGILLHWECSGYAYIEHFAIHPSMRGKDIGSKALKRFCGEHSPVVLEIDPPIDEVAVRREHFYQRLGFKTNGYAHRHPAYLEHLPPHELVVMSYPHCMTETEYQLFQRELREVVMKDGA